MKLHPSDVVRYIDDKLSFVRDAQDSSQEIRLGQEYAPVLLAIPKLVDDIPPQFINLRSDLYVDLRLGIEGIRNMVSLWQQRGAVDVPQRVNGVHPLILIRRALMSCADDVIPEETSELKFIPDTAVRTNIRSDVAAANSALRNGEWKAATILAGAALEALLFWALNTLTCRSTGAAPLSGSNMTKWVLSDFIREAEVRGFIRAESANQAKLARDFRNLIHPERASRVGMVCNKGTAFAAIAALELAISDLS